MLIRSQNKKILIDMSNLIIGFDKSDTKVICFHTAAMDGEASVILGEYSTTEKAIMVINMIEDAYDYHYATRGHVFQMPRDEETERYGIDT